MVNKVKVGLIGCGAIGTVLAEAIERKLVVCDELVVYDFDASKAQKLKSAINFPVTIVENLMNCLRKSLKLLWKQRPSKQQKIMFQKSFRPEPN